MLFVKAEDTETSYTSFPTDGGGGGGGGYGFHGRGVLIHTPRPAFVTVVKRDTGSYHVSD